MDPATAFSVACGAFQLATLSVKAINNGIEVWNSENSLTASNERLCEDVQAISDSVASLSASLVTFRAAGSRLTRDQEQLRSVSEDCICISNQLKEIFDCTRTKHGENKRRYKVKRMLKQVHQSGKIKDLRARLENKRRILDTELLVNIL